MGRLEVTFKRLAAERKKALVAYLTAGDPDLATSIAAAKAALDAGADVLEIGVPFSDPVADGPVIQRAMLRALAHGGGLAEALAMVREVRKTSHAPIVVFGYVNPLLFGGFAESCAQARQAGADALLVVDVPPEEAAPLQKEARAHELDWVSLVAPTSGEGRARTVAETASGFVYLVSMTGTTGGAFAENDRLAPLVSAIREKSRVPVCVGFGIHDRASAKSAARLGDGVVVGSAIVKALETGASQGQGPAQVRALVRELRAGLDE